MRGAVLIIAAMLAVALLAWKLCYIQPPTAPASLPQKWHEQVYELDENEVLRFVPPPYSPQRMQILARFRPNTGFPPIKQIALFSGLQPASLPPTKTVGFIGDGTLLSAAICATSPSGRFVDKELENIPVHGDWLVRGEAPEERRVAALLPMLKQITGKDFLFEKSSADTDPNRPEVWFVRDRAASTAHAITEAGGKQ